MFQTWCKHGVNMVVEMVWTWGKTWRKNGATMVLQMVLKWCKQMEQKRCEHGVEME